MTMTDAGTAQLRPVGLGELARVPVRRWRIVLAVAASVTLTALAYLVLTPASYTATSVVVVRPVVTDPFSVPNGGVDRAVDMTAETGIATSNEVIDKVAKTTGRSHEEAFEALTVEHPVGGQLMRFEYTGRSAKEAITGANSATDTYLDVRRGMYEEQRTGVLKSYDTTIKAVTRQREATKDDLPRSGDSSSPRSSALLDQLRAINDQLAQLAEQRSKIASADLSPGNITSVARDPVPSSRDGAPLYLLAAVLAGLLVGVVAALVRESMDRRVTSAADAAAATGLPLLGSVHRPVTAAKGVSTATRYLALALAQWLDREPTGPLVLLSERDDEHRTEVSAGLAAALAAAGYDVYLGGTPENLDQLHELLLTAQRRVAPVNQRHRVPRPAPALVANAEAAATQAPAATSTSTVAAPAVAATARLTLVPEAAPANGARPVAAPLGPPDTAMPPLPPAAAGARPLSATPARVNAATPADQSRMAPPTPVGSQARPTPSTVQPTRSPAVHHPAAPAAAELALIGAAAKDVAAGVTAGNSAGAPSTTTGRATAPAAPTPSTTTADRDHTGPAASGLPSAPSVTGLPKGPKATGLPAARPTTGLPAATRLPNSAPPTGPAAAAPVSGLPTAPRGAAAPAGPNRPVPPAPANGHRGGPAATPGPSVIGTAPTATQAAMPPRTTSISATTYPRTAPVAATPTHIPTVSPAPQAPAVPPSIAPPPPPSATASAGATNSPHQDTTQRVDPALILIGPGSVRIGTLDWDAAETVVLLDAPAARDDDRGVWAARGGRAVLVAARDVTRSAELRRLADRLQAAGVDPIGLVLAGDRRG